MKTDTRDHSRQKLNTSNTPKRVFSAGNLPDQAIQEFQALHQKQFGVSLSLAEARKFSTSLLDLYQFTTEEEHD